MLSIPKVSKAIFNGGCVKKPLVVICTWLWKVSVSRFFWWLYSISQNALCIFLCLYFQFRCAPKSNRSFLKPVYNPYKRHAPASPFLSPKIYPYRCHNNAPFGHTGLPLHNQNSGYYVHGYTYLYHRGVRAAQFRRCYTSQFKIQSKKSKSIGYIIYNAKLILLFIQY